MAKPLNHVSLSYAMQHYGSVAARLELGGELILTHKGKPVARLVPISTEEAAALTPIQSGDGWHQGSAGPVLLRGGKLVQPRDMTDDEHAEWQRRRAP